MLFVRMLVGESEPVDVSVESKSQVPLEAKNIIFNGSLVVDGSCLAVVIRTGDGTLIGKMVGMTSETTKVDSTLQASYSFFLCNSIRVSQHSCCKTYP